MAQPPYSYDVVDNAWKVGYQLAQTDLYRSSRATRLVPMLLMEQAVAGNNNPKFQLQGISREIGDPNFSNKNGRVATIVYRTQSNYMDGDFDPQNACNPNTGKPKWLKKQYYIDKTIPHAVEIDVERYRCENGEINQQTTIDIAQGFLDIGDKFCNSVEKQIYTGGYIGKLPSKVGGMVQTPRPFGKLPLFRANGVELNEGAVGILKTDMMMAQAGSYFSVVGDRGQTYAELKNATVANDNGTDFSQLASDVTADYVYSPLLAGEIQGSAYGVSNGSPMLAIERGALYIVSAPYYTQAPTLALPQLSNEPGVRRYSVPHPNLPGIWVNIVEKTVTQCDDVHAYPVVLLEMTINYTIVAKNGFCDYQKGFNSDGNTGLYLYFITCEDAGVCDNEEYRTIVPDLSRPFFKNCESENECETAYTCKTTYGAPALVVVGGVPYMSFTINVTPSAGAVMPTAYDWEIDGSFFVSTSSPTLLIPVSALTNGAAVSVAAVDGAGCTIAANWDVDLEGACGSLRFTYDGVSYVGQTTIELLLGALPQTGAGVYTPIVVDVLAIDFPVDAVIGTFIGNINGAALSAGTIPTSGTPPTLTAQLKTEGIGAGLEAVVFVADNCGNEYGIKFKFDVV